jgi:hypothetical protein
MGNLTYIHCYRNREHYLNQFIVEYFMLVLMMKLIRTFVFFIIVWFGLSNLLLSQSKNNEFLISVQLEKDFVTITNIKGCGFLRIGFKLLGNGETIGFNESGMFDLGHTRRQRKQPENVMFSFTVRRNEVGLLLERIDGVEWEEIVLSYNEAGNTCRYFVSQSGLKECLKD